MKTKAHSLKSRAFSLVELLVVIAVIAIVAGYAVPAVTTMLKGSQLTQGSQMVVDQIALARQTALSRNRSVEVRFYKYADPETPGEELGKLDPADQLAQRQPRARSSCPLGCTSSWVSPAPARV